MKFLTLTLCSILAPCALAVQHGGVGRPGSGAANHSGHARASARARGYGRYGGRGLYGGYPWSFSDFGDYWDYGPAPMYEPPAPAAPNVIIVNPTAPEPPPVPARLVIHEYNKPSDYGLPGEHDSEAVPSLFLIAFRDNTIRAATTYWVEDQTLHYLDRGHQPHQAPLSSVDRDLSAQLNSERQVPFSLR
ncbi:MAG TPA: hypothetical protein VMT86_05050 [Bryobacteraceae bacterium]|nr:hypothetical protein [Bryobacteraceae bacterium]